ncbi:MAG: hypothetical protein U0401_20275 [Anaerolineae bacterium]
MISSAADSLAELRLHQIGSNLYFCLKGPEPLIRAIAIALTRLLAAGPRLEKRVSLYLALLTQSGQGCRRGLSGSTGGPDRGVQPPPAPFAGRPRINRVGATAAAPASIQRLLAAVVDRPRSPPAQI